MEKKIRGFQHIIQELSSENADLKERSDSLQEEANLLKEVNSLPSGRMRNALMRLGGQAS